MTSVNLPHNCVSDRKIVTNDTFLKIIQLNNIACDLTALLDTGCPISFICSTTFEFLGSSSITDISSDKITYKALNNTPIPTYGSITITS